MILELVMTAIFGAYIVLVIAGHILLFSAIFRILREDYGGGPHQPSESEQAATGLARDGALVGPARFEVRQ